ncbi:hypothetical protein FSPOR_5609 [Fusarium sporotrichioides]|uniref:Rhodopsin domain-containing protein n=1 Tax=Fusarium sporotrichioides TaxID=5514 RepID=A0A395S6H6_FUSSP|nr:hypothetical protein FSPOR_5609 [Fusarium sporotrichioides]
MPALRCLVRPIAEMLDENARTVDPQGLARLLIGVSIFLLIPTGIVVILRCFTRLRYEYKLLHVVFTSFGIRAVYAGVGTKDRDLNDFLQVDGRKYMWIGGVFYNFSLIPLKCSICVTLLRIAVSKLHRTLVWITLIFTLVTMMYTFIGYLAACKHVSSNWYNRGECSAPVLTSVSYVQSISAVISDWACAILPGFMLYKSNMRRATKVSVTIILGLAALASVCTIVRLPYLRAFSQPYNYLYNVAHVVLWSNLESGIGIVAGSLPSLRKLVSSRFHFDSSTGSAPGYVPSFSGTSRAVITSQAVPAARRSYRGEVGDNWEQLDDLEGVSSQKIHVKVDFEMHTLERPEGSQASHGSREDLVHP